jgi:hypothetical protein
MKYSILSFIFYKHFFTNVSTYIFIYTLSVRHIKIQNTIYRMKKKHILHLIQKLSDYLFKRADELGIEYAKTIDRKSLRLITDDDLI